MMKAWMSSVSTTASDQGGAPFVALSSLTRAWSLPISSRGTRSAMPGLLGRSGAAGAGHAIGLAGLVAPRPQQAQEHAPGASRGQEPVGLTAEGAEELLAQALPSEIHGTRQIGPQLFDQALGGDAADPHGEDERKGGGADGHVEEPRMMIAVGVGEPPADIAHGGLDEGGHRALHYLVS